MTYSQKKIATIALFVSTIILTVLSVASFWSTLINNHITPASWAITFLIMALVGISVLYILYLKASDAKLLEQIINKRIEEERTKIILEFSKQEEIEQVVDTSINIEAKVEQIVPKGNFKNVNDYSKKLLVNLSNEIEMALGVFYIADEPSDNFKFICGYALPEKMKPEDFKTGENLNGQVAATKEIMQIKEIPESYFETFTGLGKSKPSNLAIVPVINKDQTIAVLEIGTFKNLSGSTLEIIREVAKKASEKLVHLQKSS